MKGLLFCYFFFYVSDVVVKKLNERNLHFNRSVLLLFFFFCKQIYSILRNEESDFMKIHLIKFGFMRMKKE